MGDRTAHSTRTRAQGEWPQPDGQVCSSPSAAGSGSAPAAANGLVGETWKSQGSRMRGVDGAEVAGVVPREEKRDHRLLK